MADARGTRDHETAPDTETAAGAALPYRRGVGVMLTNPAGRVFVAQRIDVQAEAWQMPQGGIDPGEDPLETAWRELEEETGVPPHLTEVIDETPGWLRYDLPADLRGRLWHGRYRGQEQKWFLMRFLGRDADVNLETDHPEFSAWRWVPPEHLVDLIIPFKRGLYAQVLDAFTPTLRRLAAADA
ncbi:RNA pyrophosphohydrolase [Roseospira goensis]|uniref:RNA pyrophosphohydrolase n=1 Tax=Roseospira goensis TaxID=391922 RepID=A0A7W6WLM5_9PROT|nr:RNA pyrophosphohydrolase [Roseospira goensis]MBB4286562.1 putative (di)nucleoside polyphosphate hydrolase [Roseospira goensis]